MMVDLVAIRYLGCHQMQPGCPRMRQQYTCLHQAGPRSLHYPRHPFRRELCEHIWNDGLARCLFPKANFPSPISMFVNDFVSYPTPLPLALNICSPCPWILSLPPVPPVLNTKQQAPSSKSPSISYPMICAALGGKEAPMNGISARVLFRFLRTSRIIRRRSKTCCRGLSVSITGKWF